MRRVHLFELNDLAAWPRLLRTLAGDYLRVLQELFRPYAPKADLLLRAMRAVGTTRIVDLCSGSGGPWPWLQDELEALGAAPVVVVLTDKYPDPRIAARFSPIDRLVYYPDPVDARRVPAELKGLRTLVNGFHHFGRPEAQAILQDAVDNGQPIAVFEMLRRDWRYLLVLLLTPLIVFIVTPKIRPLTLALLALTYLVPILPLVLLWDSVISCLRCYTPEELLAMTQALERAAYQWETGSYWSSPLAVTYLVGYPLEAGGQSPPAPPGD